MSASGLAMKPGELRTLTDAQLVVISVRCALRVEPWLATIRERAPRAEAVEAWRSGLAIVAPRKPLKAANDAREQARALLNASARVVAYAKNEEASYVLLTLFAACTVVADVADGIDRKRIVKGVIDTGKYAASIAAMCAHAGRVKARDIKSSHVGNGKLVDGALTLLWSAARADVAALGAGKTFAALDAKLWPNKAPRFWPTR